MPQVFQEQELLRAAAAPSCAAPSLGLPGKRWIGGAILAAPGGPAYVKMAGLDFRQGPFGSCSR